ncbi:DUF2934 domain-containing protein [Taklimakanibacter deserti]|uniref:DUF2934 domain-containing protein n=1 Tax=Taklimakanibacter deserti TaxID=2267839 RepID=UPI000E650F65
MDNDREEKIRMRAHEIWKSEGEPFGLDREHWDRAREELEAAQKNAASEEEAHAVPAAYDPKDKLVPAEED